MTTERLVHLCGVRVEVPIDQIREALVAEGALLLLVGRDRGVTIRVDDPRLLRVEIAAARLAARSAARGSTGDADDDRRSVGAAPDQGQSPSR